MQTMDVGQSCVIVGSSVVTNVPVSWGMLTVGQVVRVQGGSMWKTSVLSTQFFCDPKTAIKIKSIK